MKTQITHRILAGTVVVLGLNASAMAVSNLPCLKQAVATESAIQKIQEKHSVIVKPIDAREIKDELSTVQVFDLQSYDPKTRSEIRAFSRLSYSYESGSCVLFKYEIPTAN